MDDQAQLTIEDIQLTVVDQLSRSGGRYKYVQPDVHVFYCGVMPKTGRARLEISLVDNSPIHVDYQLLDKIAELAQSTLIDVVHDSVIAGDGVFAVMITVDDVKRIIS